MASDDLIRFDQLLTDEQRLVRDSAREFVERQARPLIRQCWRDGRFPAELIPEMARLGFLGASLEGYGCAGLDPIEYGLMMHELERCDSGLRSFVSVQSSLSMYAVWRFGSDEQKDRWLPAMQKGEAIGCFGLTEPGFGSNPGGMLSRARRDGADWLLSGEKTWITNGSIADVAVVWAKLDDTERVGGFLVERGAKGLTTSDLHGKLSMRASITSSLSFVDVRLPEAARLPGAEGLKAPLMCLSEARFGIGWGVIGAARECFETARDYALERKQFGGKPIASHQLVQQDLAWMATEIAKAQLLAMHCARLKAEGKLDHVPISMLKRNNVAIALETARRARDLLGANGITDEYLAVPPHGQPRDGQDLRRHRQHPRARAGSGDHGDSGVRVGRPWAPRRVAVGALAVPVNAPVRHADAHSRSSASRASASAIISSQVTMLSR